MATLTAANSQLALAIAGLFSSPQSIQGYAVDDAFEGESVEQAEVQMGVDGFMSAGKVYAPIKMTVSLQATSPSAFIFETWRQQQDAQGDVFSASGSLVLPGTNMSYTLVNGYLTQATPFPAGKKVLQPLKYEITWQRIVSVPTAAAGA